MSLIKKLRKRIVLVRDWPREISWSRYFIDKIYIGELIFSNINLLFICFSLNKLSYINGNIESTMLFLYFFFLLYFLFLLIAFMYIMQMHFTIAASKKKCTILWKSFFYKLLFLLLETNSIWTILYINFSLYIRPCHRNRHIKTTLYQHYCSQIYFPPDYIEFFKIIRNIEDLWRYSFNIMIQNNNNII